MERQEKNGNLHKYLRRKGKKYQKRSSLIAGRGFIPNRVDIDKRLSILDKKLEVDTIIGAGHSGLYLQLIKLLSLQN